MSNGPHGNMGNGRWCSSVRIFSYPTSLLDEPSKRYHGPKKTQSTSIVNFKVEKPTRVQLETIKMQFSQR